MSIQAVNPYPSIIFKDSFSFNNSHCESAEKILSLSKHSTRLEHGNAKSSVAYQEIAPHKDIIFKDFFDWAEIQGKTILNYWGIKNVDDFYIGNSWINHHGLGGTTLPHNHGFSGLSLVAYISLPPQSGVTEFKDPHFEFKSLHEYSVENQSLKEFYPLEVQQDDVVFFPGWLIHRSQISNSDKSRIVLSANFINFTSVSHFTMKTLYSY
jgi:Putative 2OG-Fe(II) oxygenase